MESRPAPNESVVAAGASTSARSSDSWNAARWAAFAASSSASVSASSRCSGSVSTAFPALTALASSAALTAQGLVNQLFRHCGFDRFRLGHLTGGLDLQAFRSVVGVMFPPKVKEMESSRGGHIEDVQCSGRAYADQFRRGIGSGSGIVALIALVTHRKRWFNSRGDRTCPTQSTCCANGGIRCSGSSLVSAADLRSADSSTIADGSAAGLSAADCAISTSQTVWRALPRLICGGGLTQRLGLGLLNLGIA